MHIYFIGIPNSSTLALAQQATLHGNTATIAITNGSGIYESVEFPGITPAFFPSFDPRIPGGYLYSTLACIGALFSKSDTIVVHDWKVAMLMRFLRPLLPNTRFIYVIQSLPLHRVIISFIASGFDQICTPTRTLQYRLLADFGIKTAYIPNGYSLAALADVRPAAVGLAKEKYAVVLSKNTPEIRRIARAFATTKSRKKLIVFGAGRSSASITYIDAPLTSRLAASLIRQAAAVIATDPAYSPLILQAMDAGRQIVATTDPLHEELLGVSAHYYATSDYTLLSELLKNILKKPTFNKPANIRAQHHFTWDIIGQEYERIYTHYKAVLVPFDSIIPSKSFKIAI